MLDLNPELKIGGIEELEAAPPSALDARMLSIVELTGWEVTTRTHASTGTTLEDRR